jgi:cell wall-associated NlpC family hydrolase
MRRILLAIALAFTVIVIVGQQQAQAASLAPNNVTFIAKPHVEQTVQLTAAHKLVREPLGGRALDWAIGHALYHWYGWGGTGPNVYDCSGLVQAAYRAIGITLPRTTYDMLGDYRQLRRVSHPQRGDLAFYGSGHVELYAHGNYTFGAHNTGSQVGWVAFGGWWQPSAYYEVI